LHDGNVCTPKDSKTPGIGVAVGHAIAASTPASAKVIIATSSLTNRQYATFAATAPEP
jgi:hypothetical protein